MLTVDPATRDFVDLTGRNRTGLAHLPGLDGLRGLAVAGVLAFHAGFEKMVGGYLGVSTFFTLSGFLITSLLLQESARAGSVDLRRFWTRRFRRLLPASFVTLAAVVLVFGPLFATADQRATMRGDVLSALFEVANWHDIFSGDSYAQLFASPSPVLHFWSLSIEEQFYLLFPLVLVGLWAASKGRRGVLAAGLGVLALASFLEPFVFDMSDDRVYFGTDTRASELLLGGVLAVALSSEPVRRSLAMRYRWRTAAVAAGVAALAVQLYWWWNLDQTTPWLYRGGFTLYAALSCAVITAAALPSGPMRWFLSLGALQWLGIRSYGIYLIHWPVFLAVRQTWPDLNRWIATATGLAVTMVLAVLSYRFIERPVRAGAWPKPGRALPAAVVSFSLVAAIAFIPWPVDRTERTLDFDQDLASYEDFLAQQEAAGPASTSTTVVSTPPVPAVAVFGDSTALGVGIGLGQWSVDTGRLGVARGDTKLGCGVSRFQRLKADIVVTPAPDCVNWPLRWAAGVAEQKPDVALLFSSVWEVPDAQLPGSDRFSAIGDPAVDDFVRSEFITAVDMLSSSGSLVMLMTAPPYASWATDGRPDPVKRQADPARMARFNQILAEVAAARPDTTRLVDFAGWLGPRSEDRTLRADGTHFYGTEFQQLSDQWVGPEIERQFQEWWRANRAPAPAVAPGAAGDEEAAED
jgi:peptidoglycan/LPS O-acetylase OafA/YrhL